MRLPAFTDFRPEAFKANDAWMTPHARPAQMLAAFTVIDRIEDGTSTERIAFQSARLGRLAAAARQSSAFWRDRLPASLSRLRDIPILSRAELRHQVATEGVLPVPAEHGGTGAHSTSGSTGEAVRFHASAYNALYNQYRNYLDIFAQERDLRRPLTVARAKIPPHRAPAWPGEIGQYFQTGPYRSFDIIDLTVAEIAREVATQPVGDLVMQAHVLSGVMDLIEAGAAPPPELGDILTFSETVDDALRERARRVLGARLLDRYACEEVGPLAFQCPTHERSYHVAHSNVVLETVDDTGAPAQQGVAGRVLVTGLHSFATPFIRYEIGDLAVLADGCACGHSGPTIGRLLGRQRSLLRLPDGDRRFLRFVATDWLDIAPVREFRVVQTGAMSVVAELACERPLTAVEVTHAVAFLQRRSHPDFTVEVRQVPRIDWGKDYKRLEVVCLV